jgi:hypothetical protein
MIPKVHDRLTLTCLTAEQRDKTCGYWYTLQSRMTAYTGFRTREALEFFLELHHLKLKQPLPDALGTHAFIDIEGETREVSHGDMDTLPSKGQRVLKMSNGSYTVGIVEQDDKGAIIHYVGPNATRITFDHAMSRAHEDAGHKSPMEAMI